MSVTGTYDEIITLTAGYQYPKDLQYLASRISHLNRHFYSKQPLLLQAATSTPSLHFYSKPPLLLQASTSTPSPHFYSHLPLIPPFILPFIIFILLIDSHKSTIKYHYTPILSLTISQLRLRQKNQSLRTLFSKNIQVILTTTHMYNAFITPPLESSLDEDTNPNSHDYAGIAAADASTTSQPPHE